MNRSLWPLLLLSAVSHAQVVTIVGRDGGVEAVSLHQPSLGGDVTTTGTDTFIDSTPMAARALLRWELTSVSIGTRITAAHFDLNIINVGRALEAYLILAPWRANDVSWLRRDANRTWATPGADALNVDRSATAVATVTTSMMGSVRVDLNDAGIAGVQSWIDTPDSNAGLLLVLTLPERNGSGFSGSNRLGGVQPRLVLELTDGGLLAFQNQVAPNALYFGQVNSVIVDAPPSDTSALEWPLICSENSLGVSHALLRFDLNQIPSNATVLAARVETRVLIAPTTTAGVFLAPVFRSWDLRAATWSRALLDGGTWGAPGLGPIDRGLPITRATANSAGPMVFHFDGGSALAVVQQWVSNPSSNHGVILLSDLSTGDGVLLGSPLDAGPADRPVMVVTWVAPDAGVPDAGVPDAGVPDAGVLDAGALDAGVPDAGVPDAGVPDAGVPDAGVLDAGVPDAGVLDAGVPDAGAPDAGPGDSGLRYDVGCGCNESGALLVGVLAVVFSRRRSRQTS